VKLTPSSEEIFRMHVFKRRMGASLSFDDVVRLWGREKAKEYNLIVDPEWRLEKTKTNEISQNKIRFVERKLSKLVVPRITLFIAVTGSVAAGCAKESDDIDLFVVVKDHTSWIYRGYITIRAFRDALHVGDTNPKNRLCVNFICEERALEFQDKDIFVLNEIINLKPLLNTKYLNHIWFVNTWVKNFGINPELFGLRDEKSSVIWVLLMPLNWFLFVLQVLYMVLRRHSPDLSRLIRNLWSGRIEFFPKSFRRMRINEFEEEYTKLRNKIGVSVEI
jgi:hypothetical protein